MIRTTVLANIAAEAGGRQTYENLILNCTDDGTKKALVHLLTREVAHTDMFMKALESLGKLTDPLFGNIRPDNTVNVYFNMSTNGKDPRGPSNSEPNFKYIANPLEHRPVHEAGKQVGSSKVHDDKIDTARSGR